MKKKRKPSAGQHPAVEIRPAPPTSLSARSAFSPANPWVQHAIRCAILLLIVGIVYSNSFQSGWVLDNKTIVQLDPRNKQASLENLKLIWSKDYWWPRSDTGGYRPIVSTSFLLNWSVFGSGKHADEYDQVVGFHWLNLIAHGINSVIAYFLVLKVLRRPWSAFLSSAMFAAHPIATEAVTNIIGRADEFAAMSFLGCTLLYIRSTEAHGLRRLFWLLGLMVAFGLGCFSKESAPAFMAIPLLFDAVYRWGSEQYAGRRMRRILSDSLSYLVMVPPFVAVLLVRSIVFRDAPARVRVFVDNPILRFAWDGANGLSDNLQNWLLGRVTACNVALKAMWKLLWPLELSSDYSYNQIPLFGWQLSDPENIKAIFSALFIVATLAVAVWCHKRHKAVCFFIFFYWIAYGPTSSFTVIASSIMAERFLYLPLLAFSALVVLGAESLVRRIGATLELDRDTLRKPWPRVLPHAFFVAILVLYGVRSYARNFDWHSDMTLSQSTLKAAPQAFRAYQLLAFRYYEIDPTGTIDRSIDLGEAALKILDPLPNAENNSRMYLHMGIYYGMKGETTATRKPDGSLAVSDTTRRWYERSAQVLERGTEVDLAANEAYRAGELKRSRTNIPDVGVAAIYAYLGIAYAGLGKHDKALEAFTYMRHLDPQETMAYTQIASTQMALGRPEEAVIALLQDLIVDPQRSEAWQFLMAIYPQINREPIPAVQITDGRPQLRLDNKMVQRHLLVAFREFLQIARASERPALLSRALDAAVNQYHIDEKLLAEVLNGPLVRPMPPRPILHTFGKKLADESQ